MCVALRVLAAVCEESSEENLCEIVSVREIDNCSVIGVWVGERFESGLSV